LAYVHLSLDWLSVDYASEGSMEIIAPSGNVYAAYSSGSTDLTHLELDITEAAGEEINGTWGLNLIDSYGDGGHQVSNVTISFFYEGAATTGYLLGNVTLSGEGDVSAVEISIAGITSNPDADGSYSIDLPAGNYPLTANLDGYDQYEIDVEIVTGENTTLDFEVLETVGNDEDITFVNELTGNYPNPFNPTTTISYAIATDGNVVLDIYNSKGQKISTLVNEFTTAGSHSIIWNGQDAKGNVAPSGVYFYKIKSGRFTSTKKMILLK